MSMDLNWKKKADDEDAEETFVAIKAGLEALEEIEAEAELEDVRNKRDLS